MRPGNSWDLRSCH
jgi:hypothetical protein